MYLQETTNGLNPMMAGFFDESQQIIKEAGLLDKTKGFIQKGRKEGFIFLKPQHRAKTGPREIFGAQKVGPFHKRLGKEAGARELLSKLLRREKKVPPYMKERMAAGITPGSSVSRASKADKAGWASRKDWYDRVHGQPKPQPRLAMSS